jgi:secreted trypsin-like serine protease
MKPFIVLALFAVACSAKLADPEVNPVWVSDCGKSKYPDAGVEGRIVGGRDSRPGENPWQVSLRRGSSSGSRHFCGGVIINQNWILTAAHCTEGESAGNIYVVVGDHSRSSTSEPNRGVFRASRIIENEWYDWLADFDADIALIQLTSAISFNEDVQPACPPRDSQYVGETSTVSGWGTTRYGSSSLPDILKQVNLPIPTNADCERSLSSYYPSDITPGMVCAGRIPERQKDACQGDSGGPLVVRNGERFEIVGLVSWGYGCASGYPGVYARVSYYADWIESNIRAFSN